jgi:hypothetical protein
VSSTPVRSGDALSADLDRTRHTRAQVERLIAEPSLLGPDFTPIRALDASAGTASTLLGWKASGRNGAGSVVADTLTLLQQAAELGLVERLDWAFRALTFDLAVDSGMTGELHLTPEPETFGAPCPPRLAVSILRGRRALSVCAELHDDSFADEPRLLAAVEEMQSWGWQMVYADLRGTPAEHVAQRLAARIRPAYLQVDLARPGAVSDPGSVGGSGSPVRDPGTVRWLDTASSVGAAVLALGVDDSARRDAALQHGATFGRGALLGAAGSSPR